MHVNVWSFIEKFVNLDFKTSKAVHFHKLGRIVFILTAKQTAVHLKRTPEHPYQADLAVSQTRNSTNQNLKPKDLESAPKAVVGDHGFLFHRVLLFSP